MKIKTQKQNNKQQTCVIYCRTACRYQNSPSNSILHQKELCEEYAKSNNLRILNVYVDEGQSGSTLLRPALKQLLSDLKRVQSNYIISTNPDRMSRNCVDYISLEEELKSLGVILKLIMHNPCIHDYLSALAEWRIKYE